MKLINLGGAVEITDIDLMDDDQCMDVGRVVAEECVVLVRQKIPETRLYDIQTLWGQPSHCIVDRYIGEKRLTGRHWRNLIIQLTRVAQATEETADKGGLARVSYEKNEKGKPTGLFTNGELDWHSDRQSYEDNQSVVGLLSLWGTQNSQTAFLRTTESYQDLSSEDRTMVDELTTVWKWDGGSMSKDLIPEQKEFVRYNMVPHSNMECSLISETAAGVKGIRFPSHCFSHFAGMSKEESEKYRQHLWKIISADKYKYVHDWQDGEAIFMDQNITLHARPTNIEDGDQRTLARMVSYMDRLYPEKAPVDYVRCEGEYHDHDTFAAMVDAQRREEFYANR